MALTQADLDALDTAIASAELEVEYDGRRVKFHSIDQLLKARNHVAGVVAGSTPNGRRTGSFRFTFATSRE